MTEPAKLSTIGAGTKIIAEQIDMVRPSVRYSFYFLETIVRYDDDIIWMHTRTPPAYDNLPMREHRRHTLAHYTPQENSSRGKPLHATHRTIVNMSNYPMLPHVMASMPQPEVIFASRQKSPQSHRLVPKAYRPLRHSCGVCIRQPASWLAKKDRVDLDVFPGAQA